MSVLSPHHHVDARLQLSTDGLGRAMAQVELPRDRRSFGVKACDGEIGDLQGLLARCSEAQHEAAWLLIVRWTHVMARLL